MPEEDLVEVKFRLYDGSDIGPFRCSPTSAVAMLKERIASDWPKGSDGSGNQVTKQWFDVDVVICWLNYNLNLSYNCNSVWASSASTV
ncbi:hypothetical protein SLEP1_g35468 [Rubroshorea leprosula]|uniref:UBL3-like ubiquitin domain-containing protein n=1 Tax=Rubroshorea leprosula TaxID=152421 RepID=A0AAV5KNA0_9ROSI|nr:hypothetical protein SLEP1_g35468 [Rubroshorea leprosula]